MSFALAIALWMIFFVGIAFDAALVGTYDAASDVTELGPKGETLKGLSDTKEVSGEQLGVGNLGISLPLLNVSWVGDTLELLKWDLHFFSGWTQIIRMFFLALTYGVTLMLIRDIAPAIAAIGTFLLETVTAGVGLAASGLKALLRIG